MFALKLTQPLPFVPAKVGARHQRAKLKGNSGFPLARE